MKKQYGKTITSLAMAGILATGSAVPAFAESPKFAHDEATWASLRDNVMEYNEIPLLVEEYNPTYLNNQTSYRDTREERNAWEVRDKQYENAYDAYDSAEELRSQAEDLADSGALAMPGMASVYAGMMSASMMTEQSALKTEQNADASYRDSEMDSLDYRNTQDAIIAQTQGLFASYSQVEATIETLEKNLEVAQASYESTERRVGLGMATQVDLLNAKKTIQSLQSTHTQTMATLSSLRQQLCLATGWQYDAQPEIKAMPKAELSRIAAMNPDVDAQTALEQNLSLKSNRRALSNMAEGSSDKKNMERTVKNQEETIKSGMRTMYNDVLQKQTSLQMAQAALESEMASRNAADTKYQLGMVSQLEYLQIQASFLGKQADVLTADINLQQAIETYEWALKGYMK